MVGILLLLFLVLAIFLLKFLNLWIQAYMSGTRIGLVMSARS